MVDVAIIRSMGGLVFDAVFEETHESDLEVTDNPVETGVVVSDHAFMKPLRVRISAGVSDVTLSPKSNDKFAPVSMAEAQLVRQMLSDMSVKLNNPFIYDSRSRQAFKLLQELQARAEPFAVQTGLKLYNNMVCTSIRASQDKDSSSVLLFSAELREVILTYSEMVQYTVINPAPGPTARQAKSRRKRGKQQLKEVTQKEKRQSLLIKGREIFTGGMK